MAAMASDAVASAGLTDVRLRVPLDRFLSVILQFGSQESKFSLVSFSMALK